MKVSGMPVLFVLYNLKGQRVCKIIFKHQSVVSNISIIDNSFVTLCFCQLLNTYKSTAKNVHRWWQRHEDKEHFFASRSWSTDFDGVIPYVFFTLQLHFSCSYLPLICLSTNQKIQLIYSLLIRIEWTTGNGILMSSSHWPLYNKLYPAVDRHLSKYKISEIKYFNIYLQLSSF